MISTVQESNKNICSAKNCSCLSIEDTLENFQTCEEGLDEKEAEKRLKRYGLNDIEAQKVSLLKIFASQFANFLMLLLFFGAASSFFMGEVKDGLVILSLLVINGALGTFQEYRAEKLTQVLRKHIPQKVRVRRNGEERVIYRSGLTVGDIVLVASGQIIPADMRIIKSFGLTVDESALTGESVGVPKRAEEIIADSGPICRSDNLVFAGTVAMSGNCEAVVIGIGKNTEFGKIASLAHSAKKSSSFLKQINNLSSFLFRSSLITTALIFIALIALKPDFGIHNIFLFVVALAIAIEPEMLPLISTLVVTKASQRLAKKGILIKRLSALEDLGSINIICTDKTGTITENVLAIVDVISSNKHECLKYALLSSDKIVDKENLSAGSFDAAIFSRASKKIISETKKTEFKWRGNFDPDFRWQFNIIKTFNGYEVAIKGAAESILKRCRLNGKDQSLLLEQAKALGGQGLRLLCVAKGTIDAKKKYGHKDLKGLEFMGFITFEDPIKETATSALAAANNLGIEIKILTGDSAEVAAVVAKKIGLKATLNQIVTGEEFAKADEDEKNRMCRETVIFARVDPAEKYEIISRLFKNNSVLFLGEGINDAPSLKAANVGMVVQEASDIAQESADIILTEPDLLGIVESVELGRSAINNISRYISINMTQNFGELYTIMLLIILLPTLPILPTQLLLIDFLTELIIPFIVLGNIGLGLVELKKPICLNVRRTCFQSLILACVIMVAQTTLYYMFRDAPQDLFRTLWLIQMILLLFVLTISLRSSDWFFKAARIPLPNVLMLVAIAIFVVLSPFIAPINNWFHLQPYNLIYLIPIFITIIISGTILEILKMEIGRKVLDRDITSC